MPVCRENIVAAGEKDGHTRGIFILIAVLTFILNFKICIEGQTSQEKDRFLMLKFFREGAVYET